MLAKMFLFEWRYFTRQPSFYVSALVFFTMAFLASSMNQLSMGGGNLLKNGPYMIGMVMTLLGLFSMFLVVNFVANTAMRDHSSEMSEILYSKPINPLAYQLGRFLGSYAIVVTVFAAVPFGMFVGSFMPWVEASRFGPTNFNHYVNIFTFYSIPTLFMLSCIFYALAVRFRSMMAVYLVVVAIIVAYEFSGNVLDTPDTRHIGALVDPFALRTFNEITRYWSIVEKNTGNISLEQSLIMNRIIWVSVGALTLAFFGQLTRLMTLQHKKLSNRQKRKMAKLESTTRADAEIEQQLLKSSNINLKSHSSTKPNHWQLLITRIRFEVKAVISSPAFIILSILTAAILLIATTQPMGMFGTPFWPFTQSMVEVIRGTTALMMMIIIVYYSAEVIWRERSVGIGDIVDSMPVSNLVYWLAKLVAVWSVLFLLLTVSVLVTIGVQLGKGFNNIDIAQYSISMIFFTALPWMMYTVLAFLFQVMSPNKYVGMFAFVLFLASRLIMEPIGLEHNMFRFGQSPQMQYSDINGYGWFLNSQTWYMAYWAALSIILGIVSYGLWHRGPQPRLKARFKLLSYQIGRTGKTAITAALVVFVLSGANVAYNTRYLNDFKTSDEQNLETANYEKTFFQYAESPVPITTKLNAKVDVFPSARKIIASATFNVVNRSNKIIDKFLVTIPSGKDTQVIIEGGELSSEVGPLATHWFVFETPMQIGESRQGSFHVTKQNSGFTDKNPDVTTLKNGTFINNTELFPSFGYQPMAELRDLNERQKHGLGQPRRAYKRENSRHHHQTIMGHMSGHIDFEATVSTSLEQTAIAPGYLQKEWTESDRRYFHYKMDAPIENYYSIMSAKLDVVKEMHKGVSVEVYYHPAHHMNVPTMVQAVKDSIDYYSESFGPFQHRQARIIEFPGYRSFAQSFPNTIAYSERIGFINDTRDENEINSVYYVTAHEMAHQWWGGQVEGAGVQGSTVISETMAQYSALMLTRKKYGMNKIRGILRYELDRYLAERSREVVEEVPLARVENQPHIHYRKGSVVMMSLLDLMGEERLNAAFAEFIADYKFTEGPYPLSTDLIDKLTKDASQEERDFIHKVFEDINLYNLIAKDTLVTETEDNQFEITFTVQANQYQVDGQGAETEQQLSQMVDIGLFAHDPDDLSIENAPIYLKKHRIRSGENVIKVVVSKLPTHAGIDPYVRLIDRDTSDNVIAM